MPEIPNKPNPEAPIFDPEGLQHGPQLTAEQLTMRDRKEAVDHFAKIFQLLTDAKEKVANGKDAEAKAIVNKIYAYFPDFQPVADEPLLVSMADVELLVRKDLFRATLQKLDCDIASPSFANVMMSWKEPLKILEWISSMRALQVPDQFIRAIFYRGTSEQGFDNILTYLPKAITLGLSPKDATYFWLNKQGGEDPLSAIRRMKKEGISDHYLEIYNAENKAKLGTSFKRIHDLLPLLEIVDEDNFALVSDLGGSVEDVLHYFFYIHAAVHCQPESMIILYKLEKDPIKAAEIYENGKLFPDVRFDHTFLREVLAHGLSTVPGATPEKIMSFIDEITPSIIASHPYGEPYRALLTAVTLWRLTKGDAAKARIIYHVISRDNVRPNGKNIFEENVIETYPFISNLQQKNIPFNTIIRLWDYSHDPEEAIRVNDFAKWIQPKRSYLAVDIPIDAPQDARIAFKAFSKLPPDAKDFVLYLLDRHAYVSYPNLTTFLEDPSLPLCIQVYTSLGTQNIEDAFRLGRSLFYQGYTSSLPERNALLAKQKELEALELSAGKIKLFEGRNILFLAHPETIGPLSQSRFNSQQVQDDLKKSVGEKGSVTIETPSTNHPDTAELERVRNSILQKIVTTPPPMTFFFSGHGRPDGLYISKGEIADMPGVDANEKKESENASMFISSDQIAQAVAKRKDKFPANISDLTRDIYIFNGCYNHEFIRHFYQHNKNHGGVQPITIAPSEYGQYAFDDYRRLIPLIGKFVSHNRYDVVFRLGEAGTTIGDLDKNAGQYKRSKYVVYVPNAAGQPQQIVLNDESSDLDKAES